MLSDRFGPREARRGGEAFLLLLFLAGAGWGVYELFLPHPAPDPDAPDTPLVLRPAADLPDINLEGIRRRIRETVPVPPDPAWVPPRLAPRWERIVVHHSATLTGNAEAFDRYHREERKMENGMAYHFVIGNGHGAGDGEVEVGARWREQLDGGHVRGDALNRTAIGICLVGDFSRHGPTTKQIASLKGLLRYLLNITGIPLARVTGHGAVPGQETLCPGPGLPIDFLREHLGPPAASEPARG